MAIDWGPYNGHLRVGIDWVTSPASPSHSDTSVDVTWKFYVDSDGWNFSDPQALHENADGWAGTTTNFTNNSTGGAILVDTHKETYGISYNSGSKSASANLTGAYNGATPSHSVNINLPDRPVATPSNGEAPSAGTITTDGATITWSVPSDDGGAAVDNYEVQISTGSGFGSGVVVDHTMGGTGRSYTTTALSANTHYYVRVRAHNSAGWGDWTSATGCQFTTTGGLPDTPIGLTTVSKTSTSVTIGWKASATNGGGQVTYTVDLYSDANLTTLVSSASTTTTNHQFTGLSANTTYYARVQASNTFGSSTWSAALTTATTGTGTYNDSGDYVALVNNFANAVGNKMVHLGIGLWRGKTGAVTIPNTTDLAISMGTLIEQRGPNAPTYSGNLTNNADFIIQYPGVYQIEFAFRFDEAEGGTNRYRENLYIYINGLYMPSSTNPKGGATAGFRMYNANATAPMRVLTITRRLDVGDTVGWGVWQNSGASISQPAPAAGDLYSWGKVTMVGF